jgi:hypothetical protein
MPLLSLTQHSKTVLRSNNHLRVFARAKS